MSDWIDGAVREILSQRSVWLEEDAARRLLKEAEERGRREENEGCAEVANNRNTLEGCHIARNIRARLEKK